MRRYIWNGVATLVFLLMPSCGKSTNESAVSSFELIVEENLVNLKCESIAEFEDIRICRGLVSGDLHDWGETGWYAIASFGTNISIYCVNPLAYKEVSANAWRSCIEKLIDETAERDDFKYLIPSKLGVPQIWISHTSSTLGLYFVNAQNMGVVTIVSREQQIGLQLLIEGASTHDHGQVLAVAMSSVELGEEKVSGEEAK